MSTIEVMPARLTREETEDLKRAIACLEGRSFAKRLTEAIGRPIGRAQPQRARCPRAASSPMRARRRCARR